MTHMVGVTGATGHIGGAVARLLSESDISTRLLVRTPDRAPDLENAEVVQSTYEDSTDTRAALAGVDLLFMVSATEAPDRLALHKSFVDAAVAAGVRHIVYTSFDGAAPDATFTFARDHWATEEYIKASGVTYTFLRDNFYLDVLIGFVGTDGVLRGPAGTGRVSAVAREDVVRVAAAVLRSPQDHRNLTYTLTGREAITMDEVASILTEHTGQAVSFHNETVDEAYESRRAWPAEQWQYDAWVSTYTAIAAGELEAVTDDVQRITGRLPLTLANLVDRA